MHVFIEITHSMTMTDIYQIDSKGKLGGKWEFGGREWAVRNLELLGPFQALSLWPKLDRFSRLRLKLAFGHMCMCLCVCLF